MKIALEGHVVVDAEGVEFPDVFPERFLCPENAGWDEKYQNFSRYGTIATNPDDACSIYGCRFMGVNKNRYMKLCEAHAKAKNS